MHVTFSFAFSSRYAKTRTSNFHKVVRQRTKGTVGSITWIFFENLLLFPAVKKFWKSIKNSRSYHHEFGVQLFWDTVYVPIFLKICLNISSNSVNFSTSIHRFHPVKFWVFTYKVKMQWTSVSEMTSFSHHHVSRCYCPIIVNNR